MRNCKTIIWYLRLNCIISYRTNIYNSPAYKLKSNICKRNKTSNVHFFTVSTGKLEHFQKETNFRHIFSQIRIDHALECCNTKKNTQHFLVHMFDEKKTALPMVAGWEKNAPPFVWTSRVHHLSVWSRPFPQQQPCRKLSIWLHGEIEHSFFLNVSKSV